MLSVRAVKYLKYILFSRHRKGFGIHSPFVFDLVSRVFRNKTDPGIVLLVENIRKRQISDKTRIEVLDLGSGSLALKGSLKRVCDITKYSAVPPAYGKLLYRMAQEFGGPGIVEFGTSTGISTMYLAAASPDAQVITLEGCPALSALAARNFSSIGLANIVQIKGDFDDSLRELRKRSVQPGLVFIDGNHRREATVRYFREMADMSGDETVIIVDDIHLSAEMEEAWKEILNSGNVSVSIDIFRMGMVFFRKGMSRFDYVIRY
ncbi:MAG TPA: class I SAM-dependent methyltransferase [Bacteroidales bacterium]|jgi:predicted O-methyltransferase YrrM|nr:class I SAM-dependent methyltransferase [Bacteroidales bacterium]HOS72383.1 class I SAM-dependent methyltransferase [Bacteroidales bacterium]HQH25298.1 class I SAM-dependent methyltransferase [Bacteroidales bacterium]HQJ82480.1 class I SAM-dependent methyltransferase [Bacteroidales bacterium]